MIYSDDLIGRIVGDGTFKFLILDKNYDLNKGEVAKTLILRGTKSYVSGTIYYYRILSFELLHLESLCNKILCAGHGTNYLAPVDNSYFICLECRT